MYDREDGNGLPNQTNISKQPQSRPPQYNARNCGYDCGYGCTKDEGGGAESDAETAVGEEENGPSDTETQNHDSRESEDSVSLASSTTAASDGTGLQLSWFQEESEGMSASMVVEPNSSGNHSPAPTNGSPRSLSPIPWVFTVASPLPNPYYFLQTPLRLTQSAI
jgi:hypothetical protein